MEHASATRGTTRTTLGRSVVTGAGAGVIASLAMAMYAMGASFVKDTGFFTPLHHIASVVAAPDSMMTSMESAMAGSAFAVDPGTAALGAVIHMMTGAMYGAIFGALLGVVAGRLRSGLGLYAGLGLVYGAAVFVMSAFVGLPLAAALLGGGDPIANMAQMAGWGTFLAEHLLFGLVLGVLLGVGLRRASVPPPATH